MGLSDPVVGDKMWMTPPDRFDGVGYATYGVVEPGRALVVRTRVFRSPEPIGIWSFILEPREGGSRFLVRSASCSSRILTRGEEIFETLMFEPMHFVMERRMMIGVRDRAEGRAWSKAGDVIDPLCWIFALVAALAAAFLVVMPRHGTPYLLPFTVALLYLLSEPFTGNPWGSLAQSVVLIGLFSLARRASARTTESESLSL
jgi:hypothetical protein